MKTTFNKVCGILIILLFFKVENNKIQTRPYFAGNIMLQPAYSGIMNDKDVITKFPNARKVTTDTFFLGTSPVITDDQLNYIEHTVDAFIAGR